MSTGSELVGGNASKLFIVTVKKQGKVFCIATWCLTAKCGQSHLQVNGGKLAHFEYPQKQCTYSTVWFYMTGAVWNYCYLGMLCVHSIQPRNMLRHFMQSHVHRAHACLAVTCQLHFWQNDQDIFYATAVTGGWGWNEYWNKSQHGKSTLEKTILIPILQGLEPTTFQSCVWCSNLWAIPTPYQCVVGVYVTLTDHSHIQFPNYQLSQWTHLKCKTNLYYYFFDKQQLNNNDNSEKKEKPGSVFIFPHSTISSSPYRTTCEYSSWQSFMHVRTTQWCFTVENNDPLTTSF